MYTCVFIAVVVVAVVVVVVGRFPDEKDCCLSSKSREKNVCRGRMIGLGTEMARRLTVEILCDQTGLSDQKCLNHAHAHSFDRCEGIGSITSRCLGKVPARVGQKRKTKFSYIIISSSAP